MKRFIFGKHDLVLGGFVHYAAGRPWGTHVSTQVRHPVSNQAINTSTFREPSDANRLPDTWTIDLSTMYSVAMAGDVRVKLGFEVANLTDNQEPVNINRSSGRPNQQVAFFQRPREFRLKLGLSF